MASLLTALAGKLGLAKVKIYEGSFPAAGVEFYQLSSKTLEGAQFDFAQLKGKTVLITNVACECGFTSNNYKQLVEIYDKFKDKLEIVAFPSNEFGGQESKPPTEIRKFVTDLGVNFPLMEKTHVNGQKTHPVYQALKKATKSEGEDIKWNFETKFIIFPDGKNVARFSKAFEPKALVPFLEQAMSGVSGVQSRL